MQNANGNKGELVARPDFFFLQSKGSANVRRGDSSSNDSSSEGDVVVFEQSDLHSTTFPVMTDLRRNNLLCDVTIHLKGAGDWSFAAHRVVLAGVCSLSHNFDSSSRLMRQLQFACSI